MRSNILSFPLNLIDGLNMTNLDDAVFRNTHTRKAMSHPLASAIANDSQACINWRMQQRH